MGVFAAIEAAVEQAHALPLAWEVLGATGNPILAARAYSQATGNAVDDALEGKLEELVRQGVAGLARVTGWCADGAAILERLGYQAGRVRYACEAWLEAAESSGEGTP